jgi:hypothetical protein
VIAAQDDLDFTQGDADTAFLNSELEETIYMRQHHALKMVLIEFGACERLFWASNKAPGLGT